MYIINMKQYNGNNILKEAIMKRLYYTAKDIQELLGVSKSKSYKIIRELNSELSQKGYIVVSGKIPRKFLEEKYYGMA